MRLPLNEAEAQVNTLLSGRGSETGSRANGLGGGGTAVTRRREGTAWKRTGAASEAEGDKGNVEEKKGTRFKRGERQKAGGKPF